MGGGSYGYDARRVINSQQYSNASIEEVFSNRYMSSEMDIRNKVRECKDSKEHPNAFPIIIALDVTGSMGQVPNQLIRTGLPDLMERIIKAGVKDPQICFVAFGDQYTDIAPIQVGQFESSDELMDKWLKTVYLEGHGGGNYGESVNLAWFFVANHTDCDWIDKHKKKGIIISISDDAVHKSLCDSEIQKFFGYDGTGEITTSELLGIIQKFWEVHHITIANSQGKEKYVQDCWNKLLGENHHTTGKDIINDVVKFLGDIILQTYKHQVDDFEVESIEESETESTTEEQHLL